LIHPSSHRASANQFERPLARTSSSSSPTSRQGYGIALFVSITPFCAIGTASVFVKKGKSENYFVAGRSLPLWVVTATLASQSIDANALLGNVTLSYKYHFWDGACLPIGLGLSLILNAVFLARHINGDHALTLPDVFGKRYGKLVEVIASLCCITSFIFLLAGNLAGMGERSLFVVRSCDLHGCPILRCSKIASLTNDLDVACRHIHIIST